MLCYILAQYALFVYKNILLFFDIKKTIPPQLLWILNINLVIGICKFISSKLQMLPTPTRHLQIQYQQIADASHPDQAPANSIPASCRCFRSRPGICSSNTSKLQILPTLTRHLQIQFQQIADASEPDQASANPIPASCRCFQPRPGICKSNTSKLQILPHSEFTPICICKSKSSKLQMLPTPVRHLQIQIQQIADASEPDQASAAPIPANCRCFQPRPGICSYQKQQIKDAHR